MSAPVVFTSSIGNALKETLESVIDDDTDNVMASAIFPEWMDEGNMSDNYYDYLETGGPGLAQETKEGATIFTGQINEGYVTRAIARKFAMGLDITEEALEDNKYEEVIAAAKRLKRALWKTADVDAANVLNRMFNAAYVGGDGVALGSTAHTLPGGGTFSNTMASPFAPSESAFIVARAQCDEMPGHDGNIEGYNLTGVVFPVNQRGQWEVLNGSDTSPEPGVFGAINLVKRGKLKLVPNRYWSASDTNYMFLTDVEEGFKWLWRRKPRNRSWVENSNEVMKYSISARWSRIWVDPRCALCVQA